MATTPEIKTRFTLDGLRQAATGLRGFARAVSDALGDARRRGGHVFDPMGRGLDAVERKTKTVAKELTRLGAAGTFRGIRVGALGASVAVGGLATKLGAVSTAALKAAKDSAASLKSLSIDAQRIGASTSDVAVLGYAADLTGTDRDELVTQIATISNEFLTLRENIAKAQGQYGDFISMTASEAALAARLGNREGLQGVISGFSAADLEARKASITDIEQRIAQIDGDLNAIRATAPVYGDRDLNGAYGDAARLQLWKERQQLQEAADQFRNSQSPQGQALFELEKYGIDFDRAAKGGVEGLLAISEAFERIQDPSAKARVAMRLFGEDAGVKLVPLLNGGRKAIDEYRKTLEEAGAIATKDDIANAEAYSRAVLNLKTATSGVQLTIGRALTPDLTRASQELTAWLIKSREEIAKVAVEAFRDTRVFAEDALSLFGGDTDDIKTPWLDTAVKKTVLLRDIWADVRRQVSLLWEGKDSDYGWLNKLRDGFVEVKKFAVDAWAVVSGGNATSFDWLNKARDQVLAFAKRFADAFDMLKSVVKSLGDLFKPVLDYLGTDIATLGLFLGLSRMVGLFGALTTGAGLLLRALGAVFSLGGAAAGAAGAAAAGTGGATGAALATAGSLRVALAGVGTAIGGLISSAVILGTTLAAAFALGQKAAEYFYKDTQKAYDEVNKQQAEVIKAQDLAHVNMLLRERGTDRSRAFQGRYWAAENVNIGMHGMTTDEQIAAGREKFRQNGFVNDPSLYQGGRNFGGDVIGDSIRKRNAQPPVAKRVAVDLNVAGRQTTLYGDEVSAAQFTRNLELANRGY